MVRVIVMIVLCGASASAQNSRVSWKLKQISIEAPLRYSLANAPLDHREREEIFKRIDEFAGHAARETKPERVELIMNSQLRFIGLGDTGSEQLLVRVPDRWCGSGGCSFWVFLRQPGILQPMFDGFGALIILQKRTHNGFHDITTASHYGAYEEEYRDYRWDGVDYHQVDCYKAKYTSYGRRKAARRPTIAECR
jgi:hypothetical protein